MTDAALLLLAGRIDGGQKEVVGMVLVDLGSQIGLPGQIERQRSRVPLVALELGPPLGIELLVPGDAAVDRLRGLEPECAEVRDGWRDLDGMVHLMNRDTPF